MFVNARSVGRCGRDRPLRCQKGVLIAVDVQKESIMSRRTMAAVLFAMVAVNTTAFGQETTGTVRGRVIDAQGLPIPGVTVTAIGPQGAHAAVTDPDGRFTFPFLAPATYRVRAELQGFKTAEQPNVIVSLGQTVDIPLKMEVGGLAETVNVAEAPTVIDTTSTTTGANIDADTLQRVPVGRRMSDTLYMAPGVSGSGSAGAANPSISGGSGLDNQYVIDGVNVTNQGYGALGSYSIVFGSLGNATPFDFIKEVQVKTGGYEAEFGQSTGGVVNVVTKSGSNNVRGSLFGYARPAKVEGTWRQFQSTNGSVQTLGTRNSDAGIEGGGPIMKDRLFFFGAIDSSWDWRTFEAPDGFPLIGVGGVDRERRNVSYSAKGTWAITRGHRIDASFFGDPSTGFDGPQRPAALVRTTTSAFSSLDYGGHNQTVRYDGVVSGNFLLEAYYARALNRIVETPSVNAWSIVDRTVSPAVTSGGIGFYEQGNRGVNNQWAAKATNVLGGHQIKYGLEFDAVTYDNSNQYTGPTFLAPNGQQTATGATITVLADTTLGHVYRVGRANFNATRTTSQKYFDFFVQDTWRVGSRLTINPGIRYEQEKLAGQIITHFSLKNNWAPRIGAAYDVLGDGKTKLFGNFGIFYARVPNDLAARTLSADSGITRADYVDANLTQPIPDGTVTQVPGQAPVTTHFLTAGLGADTIDPNAKLSYVNEWVGGFEHEILPNTTAGVRYIHRSIGRVLEDVANCPMVAYFLDSTSSACGSVEYILTNPTSAISVNPATAFLGASFDDPVHKYDAVEFTLNKRFSHNWLALASYRWSRLRGNFEGFYRDDNGQSDPGITSLYDFPTNDPSYTTIGVPLFGFSGDIRFLGDPNGILPLDQPHAIKLFGNYAFPMGLNVGVGFNSGSGLPLTPLAANPDYTNGGEIPTAARGSGIQTVDGFMTRTPWLTSLDAQAAYVVKLHGANQLTLLADVFNLLNSQTVLMYDNWTELSFQSPNPDFGKPISQVFGGAPPQFQTPRQIRFGLRWAF